MTQVLAVAKSGFDVTNQTSDVTQTTDTNNIVAVQGSGGSNEGYAESFLSTTTQLVTVQIKLFRSGTPTDNLVLNLTSSLGGTSLGSVTIAATSITSGQLNTFSFSSPVGITKNQTYWLQLTRSGARDVTNYMSVYIAFNTHPYLNGTTAVLNSSAWGQSSGDLVSNWNFIVNAFSANNFIFHSIYNTFKILGQGNLTSQTVNANPKTFSIAHGLGQIPTFFAFAKFPDGKVATPDGYDYTNQAFVTNGYGQFTVQADITNLYFIFTKPFSNYNVDIRYYLFEVPI